MYELLLVSQSPRRRQILEESGFLFRVDTIEISESTQENIKPELEIQRIAKAKGLAYLSMHKLLKGQKILLLSADTLVLVAGRLLGKPKNKSEAQQHLQLLSGKTHDVVTAIYVKNLTTDEEICTFDSTKVEFFPLKIEQIEDYIATKEPYDKAGSYAIQGNAKKFVKKIEGSFHNVVGLPIELLKKVLAEKGWEVARR